MAVGIDLDGRAIIVVGAGDGIGAAVSESLLRSGARLFAVDHRQELVDRTIERAEQLGGRAAGFVADVKSRTDTSRIAPAAAERLGEIHGLVNVAGGTHQDEWRELERLPDEMIDRTLQFNFTYAVGLCRDVGRMMIERGTRGSIVNLGSISALTSAPYHSVYGASKQAMIAITRTMAAEWSRHGIRVNCVSPGAVETSRVLGQVGYRSPDEYWGRRVTRPAEIAGGVLFLLSDLASGVSGQNLVIDAGLTTEFAAGGVEKMSGKIFDR